MPDMYQQPNRKKFVSVSFKLADECYVFDMEETHFGQYIGYKYGGKCVTMWFLLSADGIRFHSTRDPTTWCLDTITLTHAIHEYLTYSTPPPPSPMYVRIFDENSFHQTDFMAYRLLSANDSRHLSVELEFDGMMNIWFTPSPFTSQHVYLFMRMPMHVLSFPILLIKRT